VFECAMRDRLRAISKTMFVVLGLLAFFMLEDIYFRELFLLLVLVSIISVWKNYWALLCFVLVLTSPRELGISQLDPPNG
jgi:hypothetical protein